MSTQSPRPSTPSTASSLVGVDPGENHGNSPAAWTAVIIMLVAFALGTVAFCFSLPILVWISVVILFVGLAAGWVLKRLGYGVGGHRYVPKAHS
ncbi:MAG: rane protein [Frondihabitans sp.]|nr:rane protein [Frondihabitans sp.]